MPIAANRRHVLTGVTGGLAALMSSPALARQGTSAAGAIDAYAQAVMAGFPDQPGLAVAVVEDGEITLSKGYGVLKAGEAPPVTERTPFAIASNSKAYTAAILAMLVEEGRLEWDAPVKRYMPEFAMSDPAVTEMLSVRDLLCHRSGLALGAGDLMIFPDAIRTNAEVVAGLRHLPLATGFRSGYAYDNVLYVVAGELILAVSGETWEQAVQRRILTPLGMTDSTPDFSEWGRKSEAAWPHARTGPPVRGVGPLVPLDEHFDLNVGGAAGALYCSVRDHARWVATQLGQGQAPAGPRLWSEESAQAMWKPEVITRSQMDPTVERPDRSVISTYALGWFVEVYRGRKLVWHSGGVEGFITLTLMLPGLNKGVVVLTNAEEIGVVLSSRMGTVDRLMGLSDFDWIDYGRRAQAAVAEQLSTTTAVTPPADATPPSSPLSAYAGVYRDPWYGTVTVRERNGGLWVSFDRTRTFNGALEPFGGESFRTRFNDPNLEDAVLIFESEGGRVVRATARALSPNADFSYDFHDLRLTRED